jgi:Tol biopolymer transport system component
MRGITVFVSALIFSIAAFAAVALGYAGQTTRVSVNTAGDAASGPVLNGAVANGVLSSDGRFVVFQSSATNLVTGVSGTQVYRHDRMTGTTVLVSVTMTGGAGVLPSRDPSVSADGHYVAFSSFNSDLAEGDTNGSLMDVFVRDMVAGTTRLASASSSGGAGNAGSGLNGLAGARQISDDGRYVAFVSLATNLVTETNNGVAQVYVKDMVTLALVRASVASDGVAGDRGAVTPSISGDGHAVAFTSASTNFSTDSMSGIRQEVFVRNLLTGVTTLESPGTALVTRNAFVPVLSFDGRYLAYVAEASLDPLDLDGVVPDVYLLDRVAGTTVLASRSPNNIGGDSLSPSISGDGRWVAFTSADELMVAPDTNLKILDVFLYDRDSHVVTIVSRNDAGDQATTASFGSSLSYDGHLVLFASTAPNLDTSHPSAGNQLYVRNLVSNQAPEIPAFGKGITLGEAEPLHLLWSFSDNDSTSWTATVDYGAGQQPLTLNLNKTYSLDHLWAPGSYDMTVEVTDDARATGSQVFHVVVGNTAPSVGLLSTLDLAFTRTLDTSGTFTDPGSSETYSATVNYGDGTGTQVLALGPYDASPLVGGSFTLHHTYAAAGTYSVVVTVSDGRALGSTAATLVVNVGGYSYEWLDPLGDMFVVGRNLPVKFTVRGPSGAFVLDRTVVVDVVDANGNVMAGPYVFGDQPSRSVMWSGDSYHVNVDTKDLAAGMYWLRVSFSSPALTGEFTLATNGTAAATTAQRARAR